MYVHAHACMVYIWWLENELLIGGCYSKNLQYLHKFWIFFYFLTCVIFSVWGVDIQNSGK